MDLEELLNPVSEQELVRNVSEEEIFKSVQDMREAEQMMEVIRGDDVDKDSVTVHLLYQPGFQLKCLIPWHAGLFDGHLPAPQDIFVMQSLLLCMSRQQRKLNLSLV